MISLVLLVCSLEGTDQCQTLANKNVFTTQEECLFEVVGGAADFVESQGLRIENFECVEWGIPS